MSDRSHIDRLRLGVIAPEFPPDLGGMATLAEGFTRELARTDDVIVFAQPADGADDTYPFRVSRKIDDAFAHDLAVLRDTKVDAWLALNAGLIPLAAQLEQPFSGHGRDARRL